MCNITNKCCIRKYNELEAIFLYRTVISLPFEKNLNKKMNEKKLLYPARK